MMAGCCFHAQWIIAQGGMCPFQGKLTMPVVQLPAEPNPTPHPPPPLLSRSLLLPQPDADAHAERMAQKHLAMIRVGVWWRARALGGGIAESF